MTDAQPLALAFDEHALREEVRSTYRQVALAPEGDFHFHRGARYAAALLGYDADELALLPRATTDRFAGVGNPFHGGSIAPGETVLDLGCGAGMDLILAARRTGRSGSVIGVDMTPEMRDVARRSAAQLGFDGLVEVRAGLLEALPVPDASIDVVISNGVLNLVSDKGAVFREIRRVLKPGGRVQIADVVVARPVKASARDQAALWAACVAGAMARSEVLDHLAALDLTEASFVAWYDAYRGTSAEHKVSSDLEVRGATFVARRPR